MEAKAKELTVAQTLAQLSRTRTLSGNLLNSLGFWLFLSLVEGAAWLIWTSWEVLTYFYFYTKPLDTFGRGWPW